MNSLLSYKDDEKTHEFKQIVETIKENLKTNANEYFKMLEQFS